MYKIIILNFALLLTTLCATAQQDTLFFKQGKEYYKKGNYKKAIKYYTKAIKINPKYELGYINRGISYGQRKKYEKALTDYNTSLNLNPKSSDTYKAIGVLYEMKKNPEMALINYDKAIQLDSLNAFAYNNKGTIFCEREDYKKGEYYFLKAIKYGSKEEIGLFYFNLGHLHLLMKKHEKAIEELSHSIKFNYIVKETYLYRAEAYDALNKHEEADEDRKKVKSAPKWKMFNLY